jgi:glutamine amidotransferase
MDTDLAIVDFGAGNLRSVAKVLERLGFPATITHDPDVVLNAQGVILPGVGSSGAAMTALEERGLVEPLRQLAARGTPLFGVCLGMQLFMDSSEEDPKPCLGIVPGRVKKLSPSLKVPHMGWNQVALREGHPLFQGVPSHSNFYFVHSYYAVPDDPSLVLGTTDYDVTFCSVLAKGNLVAAQFHPEKSGPMGLKLYDNFVRLMVLQDAAQPWR